MELKSRGKSQDPYPHEIGCLRGYTSKVPGRVDICTCGATEQANADVIDLWLLQDRTDQFYYRQLRGIYTTYEGAVKVRDARRSQLDAHARALVGVYCVKSDTLLSSY